jgi:hypothetical protein
MDSQDNFSGRGHRVRYIDEARLLDTFQTLNDPCFHADDCRMKGFSKLSFEGRIVGSQQ